MKKSVAKFVKNIKINEKSINFLLIFILGFLVGVAVKTEAKKRVTIGYNDYRVSEMKQGFNLMDQVAPSAEDSGAPQPENGANNQDGNVPPQ